VSAAVAPAPAALEGAIARVNRTLATHAGAVELDSVSAEGSVRMRFTGMCAGCLLRPVTLERIVAPELRRVAGVTTVAAPGARVSPQALERLGRLPGRLSSARQDRQTSTEGGDL